MANTGNRLQPEEIRETAFGDITASYVKMGSDFSGPIRIIYMENDTDVDVYLTVNTTKNQFRIKSGGFRLLDCKTNDGFFNTGQAIYLKSVSGLPTSGQVTVEAITA